MHISPVNMSHHNPPFHNTNRTWRLCCRIKTVSTQKTERAQPIVTVVVVVWYIKIIYIYILEERNVKLVIILAALSNALGVAL